MYKIKFIITILLILISYFWKQIKKCFFYNIMNKTYRNFIILKVFFINLVKNSVADHSIFIL